MPLTYMHTYNAMRDGPFTNRVAVSLAKIAQNISTEPVGTTPAAITLHAQRAALAKAVLTNLDAWATIFAVNVALAPNIQAAASLAAAADVDIDNQVSAVWNSYI